MLKKIKNTQASGKQTNMCTMLSQATNFVIMKYCRHESNEILSNHNQLPAITAAKQFLLTELLTNHTVNQTTPSFLSSI